MKIRAADLGPEGLHVEAPLRIGPLRSDAGEAIPVREVLVRGRVVRTQRGLHFGGTLAAKATVSCARCLAPFELTVDRELDLHYAFKPPRDRELQIPDDEMDLGFLEADDGLDLAWMAAEQIYLEIPMKPLCKPACRGLCACCGADLNREGCRCTGLITQS